MSLPGRRFGAPLHLLILLLSIFTWIFKETPSTLQEQPARLWAMRNATGGLRTCWAQPAGHGGGAAAPPGSAHGPRGRREPLGRSVRAPPGGGAAARAGLCGGGGRDGACCRRAGRGRREAGEAPARPPAARSAGSAALPGRESRRRSKWGGGAERAALRGSRQPRAAARRASNAPHFSACAALPPSPAAPGSEAFVFPGRCDGRKLPGGMGSGRACAAPGSAGLRPHREVRRGERRRRAAAAAVPRDRLLLRPAEGGGTGGGSAERVAPGTAGSARGCAASPGRGPTTGTAS